VGKAGKSVNILWVTPLRLHAKLSTRHQRSNTTIYCKSHRI